MTTQILYIGTALRKYRKMFKGKDVFGLGRDIFLNDQSSEDIIEVDIGNNDKIYVCDVKTPGYPPKNFVNTFHLLGGSWINPNHRTPFDVMKAELSEEINHTKFVKLLVNCMKPFGNYIKCIPKEVHGNQNHPADYHIIVSSVFVSSVTKTQLEDVLEISSTDSKRKFGKDLLSVLKPIFVESDPGAITLGDIKNGRCKKFCWGHNVVLSDYFYEKFDIHVEIPGFDGIIVDRLTSSPLTPFSDRPETEHTRQNPIKRGLFDDSFSFNPEPNNSH